MTTMSSKSLEYIEHELFIWTEKLAACRMKLKDVQEERDILNERREFLTKKIGCSGNERDYFKERLKIDTLENRQIFRLVNDIHKLELKSLDLNEKLQIVEIEKEVKEILKAFQPAETVNESSHLSTWFRELKCIKTEPDCTIDYVKYNDNKSELSFTILYKGVSSMISIQEIHDKTSSVTNYKVRSDIYLNNLEEKTKEFLDAMLPVDNLLTFIKCEMDEDILPFINCDLSSED